MSKFQPSMLNDEVCRMATDKQTHKYIHKKHTYRVKTEETFFMAKFFIFYLSFCNSLKVKKTVSKKYLESKKTIKALSSSFSSQSWPQPGDGFL